MTFHDRYAQLKASEEAISSNPNPYIDHIGHVSHGEENFSTEAEW